MALIANDDVVAVSDGATTVDLFDVIGTAGTAGVVEAHGAGEIVAVQLGEELAVVDLSTGDVARRACPECRGVAVLDDLVVSANDTFDMLVFDTALRLQAAIPIDHVTEARLPDTEEFDQTPTVMGSLDGRVAMTYLATNAFVRGGPQVVSLYTITGEMERSWEVDGLVYRSEPDASGQKMLLGVGGAGGACYTLSAPVVIDASRDGTTTLLEDDDVERESMSLRSDDLWWNGPEPVAVASYSGNSANVDCSRIPVLWRFPADGNPEVVDIEAVDQYRFVGEGCDQAFLVTSEDGTRLDFVNDGRREPMAGYHAIVWTAPRTAPCDELAGIESR